MDPSYNNSFGSFGSGGQTIGSGTGDIALYDNKKKSNKKPWIIVGVLVAIVAIGLAAFFIVPRKMKTAATSSLDEYSRLLIYGENNSEKIPTDGTWSSDYFAGKVIHENEGFDEQYFNNLENKYGDFVKKFEEEYKEENFSDSDEYELLQNMVGNVKNALSMAKEYAADTSDKDVGYGTFLGSDVVNNSAWIYSIIDKHEGQNEKK